RFAGRLRRVEKRPEQANAPEAPSDGEVNWRLDLLGPSRHRDGPKVGLRAKGKNRPLARRVDQAHQACRSASRKGLPRLAKERTRTGNQHSLVARREGIWRRTEAGRRYTARLSRARASIRGADVCGAK